MTGMTALSITAMKTKNPVTVRGRVVGIDVSTNFVTKASLEPPKVVS